MIANDEKVTKSLRHKKCDGSAFSFEESIGPTRCGETEIERRKRIVERGSGEKTGSENGGFFVGC